MELPQEDYLAEARQFFDQMVDLNIPSRGLPCELEGILESMCMPLADIENQMPFCGDYVNSQICVPAYLVSCLATEPPLFHHFQTKSDYCAVFSSKSGPRGT